MDKSVGMPQRYVIVDSDKYGPYDKYWIEKINAGNLIEVSKKRSVICICEKSFRICSWSMMQSA